ncbi:hypothetical protein JCM10450v2_008140 [Rhodotorula kratochvilovae]
MPPWTGALDKRPRNAYAPLPGSPSPSSLPLASAGAGAAGPPARISRRLALVLGGALALAVFGSLTVVPEEHLPLAVGAAKEGVVGAAGAAWRWDAGSEAQQMAEELAGQETEDLLSPDALGGTSEGDEGALDHAVAEESPRADVEEEDTDAETDSQWFEAPQGGVECPASVKEQLGRAAFWAVEETAPLLYRVAPRTPLGADVPSVCLSQAVFTARLLSLAPNGTLDAIDSQTLVALPRPHLGEDLASYTLALPPNLAVPRGRYQLDVHLEFGFFPGVLEGEVCGEGQTVCDERALGEAEGKQLRFVGERVEVLSGQVAELGQDPTLELPRCTDLSSNAGYWSDLSYFPASPPCTLTTPTVPLLFLPTSTSGAPAPPLWVHIVGDSNSRNMFTHLTASFGSGRKISAEKIVDSPTHNGTHASVAFRFRSGSAPKDAQAQPDLVVTWAWWYQAAPSARALAKLGEDGRATAFEAEVVANRDELVSLVDTDLASFRDRAHMSSALGYSPALASLAGTLRPHRTYLSLGSHGEQLSRDGVSASLDTLFSESSGLSRAARDRANLRLFTTSLVNPRHIPLARFPHQDLVRNNALIGAKNALAAQHPALAREGRVINVEALTRGVVESDEWMKQIHGGPDAVHFRDEVYDEWVRLVWTDLMRGVEVQEGAQEVGVEEARRRWKRRLEREELDEEEEEDAF